MTRIFRAADQLKNPLLTILAVAMLISYVRVNELNREMGETTKQMTRVITILGNLMDHERRKGANFEALTKIDFCGDQRGVLP